MKLHMNDAVPTCSGIQVIGVEYVESFLVKMQFNGVWKLGEEFLLRKAGEPGKKKR